MCKRSAFFAPYIPLTRPLGQTFGIISGIFLK